MVKQVDGHREGKKYDAHDESEAQEVEQRFGQRLAEDRDGSVIAQQMQQLQLGDECDYSNHTQVQLVEVNNRVKTHHFSYSTTTDCQHSISVMQNRKLGGVVG